MSVMPDPPVRLAPWRVGRATIGVFLLMRAFTSAQDVTESALKAAFIYNFVKFTEWPTDVVPAGENFVMCVLGDTAVAEALERAVKTRLLDGHSLTVVQMELGAQRVCHVLYVSGVTAGQAAQVVARGRDAPVLTISDLDRFTELGGMVQFFFDQGRLRFSVHLDAVKRARLEISSRLLILAKP